MTTSNKRKRPHGSQSARKRLSGKLVAGTRARMCLSVGDFAACLGVSLASAYRWEADTWPRLRPSVAAIAVALAAKPDDELKALGAAIVAAREAGQAFQASRLVLDAVATTAAGVVVGDAVGAT
jgi:DNA-binding transcriptional regulator YiaG